MGLSSVTDVEIEAYTAIEWQNWNLSPGLSDLTPHKPKTWFREKIYTYMDKITHAQDDSAGDRSSEHVSSPGPSKTAYYLCDFEHLIQLITRSNILLSRVLTPNSVCSRQKRERKSFLLLLKPLQRWRANPQVKNNPSQPKSHLG